MTIQLGSYIEHLFENNGNTTEDIIFKEFIENEVKRLLQAIANDPNNLGNTKLEKITTYLENVKLNFNLYNQQLKNLLIHIALQNYIPNGNPLEKLKDQQFIDQFKNQNKIYFTHDSLTLAANNIKSISIIDANFGNYSVSSSPIAADFAIDTSYFLDYQISYQDPQSRINSIEKFLKKFKPATGLSSIMYMNDKAGLVMQKKKIQATGTALGNDEIIKFASRPDIHDIFYATNIKSAYQHITNPLKKQKFFELIDEAYLQNIHKTRNYYKFAINCVFMFMLAVRIHSYKGKLSIANFAWDFVYFNIVSGFINNFFITVIKDISEKSQDDFVSERYQAISKKEFSNQLFKSFNPVNWAKESFIPNIRNLAVTRREFVDDQITLGDLAKDFAMYYSNLFTVLFSISMVLSYLQKQQEFEFLNKFLNVLGNKINAIVFITPLVYAYFALNYEHQLTNGVDFEKGKKSDGNDLSFVEQITSRIAPTKLLQTAYHNSVNLISI